MRDRLEDRRHVGAHALAGLRFQPLALRIERQAAIERDGLAASAVRQSRWKFSGKLSACATVCEQDPDARRVVNAPAPRVPAGPRGFGGGEIGLVEREVRAAEAARNQPQGDEDVAIRRRRAARDPFVSQRHSSGAGLLFNPMP